MKTVVIYGFLGSGKTTFIENFVQHHAGEKVVILENEAGNHSIDSEWLEQQGNEVVSITSGCVCCTLRGKLQEEYEKIRKERELDYLILEPSGIAALDDLLSIRNFSIDLIVTLVDVQKYDFLMKLNEPFYQKQYAFSPILILTKTDLVEKETVDRIHEKLSTSHPKSLLLDHPDEFFTYSMSELYEAHSHFHNYSLYGEWQRPEFKMETYSVEDWTEEEVSSMRRQIEEKQGEILRWKDDIQWNGKAYSGKVFICWKEK